MIPLTCATSACRPLMGINATDGHLEDSADPAAIGLDPEPVSPEELNAWRRGFTPQAEIWNGRLAMIGLSVGLLVVVLARLASG